MCIMCNIIILYGGLTFLSFDLHSDLPYCNIATSKNKNLIYLDKAILAKISSANRSRSASYTYNFGGFVGKAP